MTTRVLHLLRLLPFLFGGHRQLALEDLALRQQLAVYKRMLPRPKLRTADRLLLIGSIRRECLNHVLVLGERHVRRVLVRYFSYYHRAHLALDKDAPGRRPIELPATGTIGAPAAVGETRSPGFNPGSQPWPRVSRGAERVGRRFDGEGQVIRLWNLAAETMFGHGATEAIGQTLDLIVPEPHRVAHWAGFSHAVKQGRFAKNDVLLTSRALTKDGRIIAAELLGRHCPEPLWPSSGHHGRLDEM